MRAIQATDAQWRIFEQILEEREHQDLLWGPTSHDLPFWMTILLEELGEAAEAALADVTLEGEGSHHNLLICRAELIQVAAVAMAAIEDIDSK